MNPPVVFNICKYNPEILKTEIHSKSLEISLTKNPPTTLLAASNSCKFVAKCFLFDITIINLRRLYFSKFLASELGNACA